MRKYLPSQSRANGLAGMVLRGGHSKKSDDENSSEEEVPDPTVAGERCQTRECAHAAVACLTTTRTGFEMDLKAFTALAQQCGLVGNGRKDAAPLLQRADIDILFQVCTPGSSARVSSLDDFATAQSHSTTANAISSPVLRWEEFLVCHHRVSALGAH